MQLDLPVEWSLSCGPVQSAYSRTEKAATTESGVCRVFDKAPVARGKSKDFWVKHLVNHKLTNHHY